MAKRKDYGMGKSVKEIFSGISRNISRATEKTLRSAVTRLSSAMNKRIDRAAKEGRDSPALREVRESGGRFSAKGKDKEGLKAEFIRLKNFFSNPTSTQKGWEKVQKQATREAQKRGVLKTPPSPSPSPKGQTPPSPSLKPDAPDFGSEEAKKAFTDVFGGEDIHGMGPTTGEQWPGWTPPPGWTWDEESRSWTHPDHGKGWIPYEEEGGGMLDPITGEIVGNTARGIHDYDVTRDDKVWGTGTETGEIWRMVDSIAKMDPRFKKRDDSDPRSDPRMQLFAALDDAWAGDDSLSFEDARDLVAQRLDEIYAQAQSYFHQAEDLSPSTYFSDDDDW